LQSSYWAHLSRMITTIRLYPAACGGATLVLSAGFPPRLYRNNWGARVLPSPSKLILTSFVQPMSTKPQNHPRGRPPFTGPVLVQQVRNSSREYLGASSVPKVGCSNDVSVQSKNADPRNLTQVLMSHLEEYRSDIVASRSAS
jgi:hypothetical protein